MQCREAAAAIATRRPSRRSWSGSLGDEELVAVGVGEEEHRRNGVSQAGYRLVHVDPG